MATTAKVIHQRVHARGAQGQDGEDGQGGQRGGGDPVGLGGIVGNGQMRLDRHEGGGERQLDGNVNEERRRPKDFAAQVHAAAQREAPDHRACDRRSGEPQPAAQAGKRIGGTCDDGEIDHERPGVGLLGLDEQRHDERAREPEAGKRRPMQGGGKHGGDADGAEQDEGRGRADELVQRMRGVDGAERADGARGGQDARDVRGGNGADGRGALGSPEPFAGRHQSEREQRTESNAHARAEHALLDGIAHQQHAAERQREAADPDGPARAEPLFQRCCRSGCDRAALGCFGERGVGSASGFARREDRAAVASAGVSAGAACGSGAAVPLAGWPCKSNLRAQRSQLIGQSCRAASATPSRAAACRRRRTGQRPRL